MGIVKENTVAEVVSKKLGSDHIFSKYKIDFCCGGGVTLETACKEKGIAFETLKHEIESLNNKIVGMPSLTDHDLGSLMQLAKTEYHPTIERSFKEILPLASKVANVHGENHSEVITINELLQEAGKQTDRTIASTLDRFFPAIDDILSLDNPSAEITFKQMETLRGAIDVITAEKSPLVDLFNKIANLSSNYTVPEDACNSYRSLYQNLQQLDFEVHKYIHFEKHVLIPKSLKIIE
ncbi:DUF542 domain-containing protein [Maribacter polysaccharolyticus]|uniref:DUF542 domain-containing protein n=1 Tax=Maribacter polysaccharolyticus TaxID=3020831 RepID=UPI00237EF178|nr:DUF542 domain-containing protein [Maribacter polysaccharolyticus]MDE3740889.1 DUF542 domain-containing protein [Maribacter polysaccharolyticus]